MFPFGNLKGTLSYEVLQLAYYWAKVLRLPTDGLSEEKISYGPHPRQYVLHFPSENNPSPPKGTIIYLHGGGWRFGSPEAFRSTARFFTQLNYSVILPSHRRCPAYDYRAMRADLIDILKACKSLAITDPVILGGMSSGGHLSAMIFLDDRIMHEAGWQIKDLHGAFFLGAPLQLEKMADSRTLRNMAGKRNTPLFQEANPFNFIGSEEKRPLLVVHGDQDAMVSFAGTQAFVEKLQQSGSKNLTFEWVNNGSHLDVASWSFEANSTQKALLNWLNKFH